MSQLRVPMDPDTIPDDRPAPDLEPEDENTSPLFEGPRYRFSLLLGESSLWSGPLGGIEADATGIACRWCGRPVVVSRVEVAIDGERLEAFSIRADPARPGKRLPPHVYCLGCERSGKDSRIGSPPPVRVVRRVYRPHPKLKGGVS